jgi:hypothetical protein
MCDRHFVQQGVLNLLPRIVVVPDVLSMLPGYPAAESGGAIENDVLSHGVRRFGTPYSK